MDWQKINQALDAHRMLNSEEREAFNQIVARLHDEASWEPPKRGRGRPKGSKTKKPEVQTA